VARKLQFGIDAQQQGPGELMRHRRTPPSDDQVDEQARFECMQLVREGTLDNWTVFVQREAGVPWSTIRGEALTKQQK